MAGAARLRESVNMVSHIISNDFDRDDDCLSFPLNKFYVQILDNIYW